MIYDVIIIGGGTSGLATASHLSELGHTNILVLEASDRLGGRIQSIQTSDGLVEMGAQWIHGSKKNPLYTLLKSMDEVDESYHYWNEDLETHTAYPNGMKQPEDKVDKIVEEIEYEYYKIFESLPRGTRINESVGNLMDIAIEKNTSLKKFDPILVQALFNSFMNSEKSDYGCNSFRDLSAVAASKLWDVDFEGNENVNLKNGFIKLIYHLASKVPETAIKLNEKVININWIGELTTVKAKSELYGDILNYQAKYVVTSLPLGVLKSNYYSLFSPPLPTNKINAIAHLSFGIVNKIFLVFDREYFPDSSDVRFLWPDGFDDLVLKSSPDSKFYRQFTQFTIVPNRPNIMVTEITGEDSVYMESLSDEKLLDVLHELFQRFYPGLNLPRPKLIRSKWGSNPLSEGSYTFIPTGSSIDDVYNFAKPIDNKLFFIGEATSVHIGTVTGAYETGLRAAKIIDNLFSSK